jgi:hypothetical protein
MRETAGGYGLSANTSQGGKQGHTIKIMRFLIDYLCRQALGRAH